MTAEPQTEQNTILMKGILRELIFIRIMILSASIGAFVALIAFAAF
ncbi:MAG: hypothetical protein P9L94_15355 [Candidatus Hinthialibacter antarcticus]|nr:hypothetical protein [Candidatus Hinthialibacter antarcticus]